MEESSGLAIYLIFTAAMFLASMLYLKDALGDRYSLTFYVTSIIYGLVLEKVFTLAFQRYSYPASKYLFSIFGIPVAIGLGWSAVIYASFKLGKQLNLSRKFLPVFTGLFALHFDLLADVIAIKVPFWTWTPPGHWFGVWLGNFYGWYLIAALFTGYFLLLKEKIRKTALLGVSVLAASLITLIPLAQLWIIGVTSLTSEVLVLSAIFSVSLLFLTKAKIKSRGIPVDTFLSFLVLHLFFLAVLIYYGFYVQTPLLLPLSIGMLCIGIITHLRSHKNWAKQKVS